MKAVSFWEWARLRAALLPALILGVSFSGSNAQAERFIVRARRSLPQGGLASRALVLSHTQALRTELVLNSNDQLQKVVMLPRLGTIIVDSEDPNLEAALQNSPLVEYYERDKQWRVESLTSGSTTPAAQAMAPWMKDVMGLEATTPDPTLSPTGYTPVLVAIVDTGMTCTHPYLQPAGSVNSDEQGGSMNVDDDGNHYIDDICGGNAIEHTGDVTENGTDHGSHVAGLIKSVRDQAITLYPEARGVQLLPIRFIDDSGVGSTSGAIAALEYAAARGAKVMNASWGAPGEDAFSQALYDAMADLYNNHDMLLAVAAGNADRGVANNNDATPYFPASFNIPSMLTVASITPEYVDDGTGHAKLSTVGLSDFSNYGANSVNIAAPGGYRDINFDSSGVWSANAHSVSTFDLYIRKKGTSMATPLVAGVAAVMRAINPSLTSYEVKDLILRTGHVSSGLSGYVSSSAWLRADAAFSAAHSAVTQNKHPAVTGKPYNTYQSPTSSAASTTGKLGGCGAITDVAARNSAGNGPLGGNSLGIVSLAYIFAVMLRRFRRHLRGH